MRKRRSRPGEGPKKDGTADDIAVLSKAFAILDVLEGYEEPLALDKISEQAGVARTTAFRLLQNLTRHGYVDKDGERYMYQLGPRLLELGNVVKRRQTTRDVALPFMQSLREELHETVNLGVLHKGEVLYLEVLESLQPFRIATTLGVHDPPHATSLGKAMLAYLDPREAREIIQSRDLKKLTRKTVVDEAALMAQLQQVRERGYAIDDEETVEGGRCLGAPIFGADGNVVAAISISGPILRIGDERIPTMAEKLKTAAAAISRRLGWKEALRPAFTIPERKTRAVRS